MFNNIEFANTSFFLLLAIIPILGIYYFFKRNSQKSTLAFSNGNALKAFSNCWKIYARHTLNTAKILALGFFIVAMARPQSSTSWQDVSTEGIDIMMCLDISGSMLAEDFKPNRLEASKEVAMDFIAERPNDRIGLVIYGGESFTQCPLTSDHDVLLNLFGGIQNGMIEDGTAIGMGLATSVNRLKDSRAKSKVIILLTDGVNNSGFIDPKIATELAVEFGIKTYTIGLGSNGTARAPVGILPNGSFQYAMTKVEIDEALLQEIATATGGIYFRATDNKKLEEIYEEINKLEKTEVEEFKYYNYEEKYRILILLALILIVLEWIGKNTIFKSFI